MADIERRSSNFALSDSRSHGHRYRYHFCYRYHLLPLGRLAPSPPPPGKPPAETRRRGGDDRLGLSRPAFSVETSLVAQDLLEGPSYFGVRLSRSRFNRRLHALDSVMESFFEWLGQVHRAVSAEDIFLIDSCPVEVCDNTRIDRCRIYPKTATSGAYGGYNSSKRRYFYGLKVHMVTTAEGNPVEVSLTPGSYNDTGHLRTFELDLPEGSVPTPTRPRASTSPRTSWPRPRASSSSRIGRKTRSARSKPMSNTFSRSTGRKLKLGSAD
jgi:hypothetical protein